MGREGRKKAQEPVLARELRRGARRKEGEGERGSVEPAAGGVERKRTHLVADLASSAAVSERAHTRDEAEEED